MAQPEAVPSRPPEPFRARHRRQRRSEFLQAAQRIVAAEGITALTMQRVTDDLGCAVGSIYRYFPTKGALVAAVQAEALELLGGSLRSSQDHLEQLLAERTVAAPLASLTRVLAAGRFWIGAEAVLPQEIELTRRIFTHPGPVLTDDEAGLAVLPAAWGLLQVGSTLLEDAATQGALSPGSSVERSIIVLAGTTGVMLTSGLDRWEHDLFEGSRLAEALLSDLLLAWGAEPEQLVAADRLVEALAALGRLVPEVDRDAVED